MSSASMAESFETNVNALPNNTIFNVFHILEAEAINIFNQRNADLSEYAINITSY